MVAHQKLSIAAKRRRRAPTGQFKTASVISRCMHITVLPMHSRLANPSAWSLCRWAAGALLCWLDICAINQSPGGRRQRHKCRVKVNRNRIDSLHPLEHLSRSTTFAVLCGIVRCPSSSR